MNLRTILQPITKRHYAAAETAFCNSSSSSSKTVTTPTSSSSRWFSTSTSTPKPPEIPHMKLDWSQNATKYQSQSDVNIVTFNMLAPVYKRLSTVDLTTGYRKREAQNIELWKARAAKTLAFFRDEVFTSADLISLQEFWLDDRYLNIFSNDFKEHNYDIYLLQRTGRKLDAVAILVKKSMFEVLAVENIYLCTLSDRVALLLWLRHRVTNKDILIANTHLSFPHNQLDKLNQMRQMKNLTSTIDRFAKENHLSKVTCMIMGDFNVESNSPVCDHLRHNGYHSCFEVQPPMNTVVPEEAEMIEEKLKAQKEAAAKLKKCDENHASSNAATSPPKVTFVSHRNHQAEDVGVDHIFVRPENMSALHLQHLYGTNTSEEDASDSDIKFRKEKVFIDSCHVLPANLSCKIWNEKFTVSDHRPVGAKIVFGVKKV